RSQEGWSFRRIAKAIGTAALYASGQVLSGTQQAMGEFSGQSGSGVAPFLVGTTVLTLPSYVGGEHLSWEEAQETLAPPAYGEDQVTREESIIAEETTTFDATSPREEPSTDPMQRGEDGLTYIDPNVLTPAETTPALRGTVPATVTIDEGGELECSLPVTHSSTDGSLSLLEVGVITGKDSEDIKTFLSERSPYFPREHPTCQLYQYYDRLGTEDASEEIEKFVQTLSLGAQEEWDMLKKSSGQFVSPPPVSEDERGRGAGAGGAGGAAGDAAESDEDSASDNEGMDEEEGAAATTIGHKGTIAVRASEVFNRRTHGEDKDTLPAMVYWKGTTAFCLKEDGVNPLYLLEPLIYSDPFHVALRTRTVEIRRRKTTDPRKPKPARTNVAIGSLRLFYKGDDHAWNPLHRESVITSNSFVVIDNPAALPPAILRGGFFKSGWRQQQIGGILVDATPQSILVGQYAYSAISDIGDDNSDRNKKISINEYMRFLKNRADLFFPSELTALQRNVLSDFYLYYDYNPQAVEFSFNRLPQGIEAGTTAILGQKGGCINVDYISKYLKGLATKTAQDYLHTEQAIIKRLEEDSQRCLDAREAATPERPIDLRGCHLGTHLGADLIGRMHDTAAIFNLNILSYLSMCDKCAGTLFREGETGQLFLENYRRAFQFRSLKLIVTMDAIELRDNGHISFGKWVSGDTLYANQDRRRLARTPVERLTCDDRGYAAGVEGTLPNYALKEGPWIVHRFVEGPLTSSFNTGYQIVGDRCPYYDAPAAAGAGGVH
ncbi:MAG: hypothetical protein Q8Q56_02920, partial [Alphaproteobacteria bacterium]|nr:hypothetical protein [Alphaproteobacteria bacterium]